MWAVVVRLEVMHEMVQHGPAIHPTSCDYVLDLEVLPSKPTVVHGLSMPKPRKVYVLYVSS